MRALQDAIKIAEGPSALARRLCVAPSLPSMWLKRGRVPADHCAAIEMATGVSRRRLRPTDWRRIWPELAAEEKAAA